MNSANEASSANTTNNTNSTVKIAFDTPLQEARFIERPNRFLIHCQLVGKNTEPIIEAHLPDPGRLKELLTPGAKVWLRPVDDPKRKTKYSAVLCESPDQRTLVSIDTTYPNRLIEHCLRKRVLQEWKDWQLVQREYKMGGTRWDFLLEHEEEDQKMVLEVKSVTLVKNGVGLFPDAITARGAKHVRELARIYQRPGWKAAVLFVVQRSDVHQVHAAGHIDPTFATALAEAKQAGVGVYARKCHVALDKISIGERIETV